MQINDISMCGLTVIPVRASSEDTSEMVTQLLFGEIVKTLELYNQWVKVEIEHDGYIGWVDSKQLILLGKECEKELTLNPPRQIEKELELFTPWGIQRIVQGSPLLSMESHFSIHRHSFSWVKKSEWSRNDTLLDLVNNYINAPYLWGGRTYYGIDCSGFTQTIFHQLGIYLKRDAAQQALEGEDVDFEKKEKGDLAFFLSEKSGKVTHVGIILEDSKIVHAHGRVRIDLLTEEGIYNETEEYHSHKLHKIKRHEI